MYECKIFKVEKRQQEGYETRHHRGMNLTFLWGWGQIDEASAFLTCKGKETRHITAHTLLIYGQRTAFIQPFSNQWPIKALYNFASHSPVHAHIHTPTAEESATQGDSQLFWLLAQGHLDTPLGGAGDRTSNLTVTGQPTLTSWFTCHPRGTFKVMCLSVWRRETFGSEDHMELSWCYESTRGLQSSAQYRLMSSLSAKPVSY